MKNNIGIVCITLFISILITLIIWNAPLSRSAAFKLAEEHKQIGNYCSGYHIDKGDGTAYVVFRSCKTDRVVDEIRTHVATADDLYEKYN